MWLSCQNVCLAGVLRGKRINDKQVSLTTLLKWSSEIHWLAAKKQRFCFLEIVIVILTFFYHKNLLHLTWRYKHVCEMPLREMVSVNVLWAGHVLISSNQKSKKCATTDGKCSVSAGCFLPAPSNLRCPCHLYVKITDSEISSVSFE